MRTEKAQKIKETLSETGQRRKTQVPRVYQLKLQNLSKKDEEKLEFRSKDAIVNTTPSSISESYCYMTT